MQIPFNFEPRSYQNTALTALDNGSVMNVWCWSRRGGKDYTAFSYAVKKMVEKPINVVIIWPTKKQGYDNFWTAVSNDGIPVIEHIPASLIAQKTNSPTDMHITLKNGSTLTLLGATDPEALRGANGLIYIFSEFVDIPAAALDVIRPIVAVNGGQIIIQSTPKIDGTSGGTFKILFDRAIKVMKEGGKQFASRVTADAYLSKEQLEDIRQETIAKNGNDFWFQQEFMCDWGQVSQTSYYGAVIAEMRKRGMIGRFPYDPAHPVYTAWDLGTADSTAITFFQYINKKVRIIDYYETHDIGYAPIVEYLKTKPYNMVWHFIPWDGATRDQSDAIQRIDKLVELGLPNCSLLRKESKEDGIRRAVEEIAKAEVNVGTTEQLVGKLIKYKRKFNPLTGDYEGPEHKTESHAADSVRYVFKAIKDEFNEKTGAFLFAPDSSTTYDSEDVNTPKAYDYLNHGYGY